MCLCVCERARACVCVCVCVCVRVCVQKDLHLAYSVLKCHPIQYSRILQYVNTTLPY